MMDTSPLPSALPCSVQPRVETSWLALPLSARGLVDELSNYKDENARIIVCLDKGTDFRAVGKEIARLLCAHPGELARVRSDTKKLMDDGFLAVDGSALRLSRIAHETARSVERSEAMTDAERSRRYRENKKLLREAELESSRTVTGVTKDRDDLRDDRHVTFVTRPLSFKEDFNLKSLKEREDVTAIVTAKRDAVPAKINEARRAKAKQRGLQDHRIDLVWAGFVPKHAGQKRTEVEWDDRWEWWVANQLILESAKAPAPKSAAKTDEVQPSWMREAMGEK
jgi:hypothetical protein